MVRHASLCVQAISTGRTMLRFKIYAPPTAAEACQLSAHPSMRPCALCAAPTFEYYAMWLSAFLAHRTRLPTYAQGEWHADGGCRSPDE